MAGKVIGKFEMSSGNLIKTFNDLNAIFKSYPDCTFEISDDEKTYKKS